MTTISQPDHTQDRWLGVEVRHAGRGAGQDAAPGSTNGSVDGDGGSIDISAGTFITMNGPMFGISKGFGQVSVSGRIRSPRNTVPRKARVSAARFHLNHSPRTRPARRLR